MPTHSQMDSIPDKRPPSRSTRLRPRTMTVVADAAPHPDPHSSTLLYDDDDDAADDQDHGAHSSADVSYDDGGDGDGGGGAYPNDSNSDRCRCRSPSLTAVAQYLRASLPINPSHSIQASHSLASVNVPRLNASLSPVPKSLHSSSQPIQDKPLPASFATTTKATTPTTATVQQPSASQTTQIPPPSPSHALKNTTASTATAVPLRTSASPVCTITPSSAPISSTTPAPAPSATLSATATATPTPSATPSATPVPLTINQPTGPAASTTVPVSAALELTPISSHPKPKTKPQPQTSCAVASPSVAVAVPTQPSQKPVLLPVSPPQAATSSALELATSQHIPTSTKPSSSFTDVREQHPTDPPSFKPHSDIPHLKHTMSSFTEPSPTSTTQDLNATAQPSSNSISRGMQPQSVEGIPHQQNNNQSGDLSSSPSRNDDSSDQVEATPSTNINSDLPVLPVPSSDLGHSQPAPTPTSIISPAATPPAKEGLPSPVEDEDEVEEKGKGIVTTIHTNNSQPNMNANNDNINNNPNPNNRNHPNENDNHSNIKAPSTSPSVVPQPSHTILLRTFSPERQTISSHSSPSFPQPLPQRTPSFSSTLQQPVPPPAQQQHDNDVMEPQIIPPTQQSASSLAKQFDDFEDVDLVFTDPRLTTIQLLPTHRPTPVRQPQSVRDRPPTPIRPSHSLPDRPPPPVHPTREQLKHLTIPATQQSAQDNPASNFQFDDDQPITIALDDDGILALPNEQEGTTGTSSQPPHPNAPCAIGQPPVQPAAVEQHQLEQEQLEQEQRQQQADYPSNAQNPQPVSAVEDEDVMEIEPCVQRPSQTEQMQQAEVHHPATSSEVIPVDNDEIMPVTPVEQSVPYQNGNGKGTGNSVQYSNGRVRNGSSLGYPLENGFTNGTRHHRDDSNSPERRHPRGHRSTIDLEEPNDPMGPICISDDDDDDEMQDVSDVEFIREKSAAQVVSGKVKFALDSLHLNNIIVTVHAFAANCGKATVDDLAVIQAIEDYYRVESSKRRKSQDNFISASRGSVLIVCGSLRRAQSLYAFFERNGKLRVALHTYNNRRDYRTSYRPLDDVLGHVEIVISNAKIVLTDAQSGAANFKNVLLLVLDSVEKTHSRAHPIAMMMRDHYRSFGESARPRVLAIARSTVHPNQAAPLEHNLFSKMSSRAVETLTWKSPYGKGSRKPDHDLVDVEFLTYQRIFTGMRFEYGRKPAIPARVRDRRAFTTIDSVVDEVGPLGVKLYRRRSSQKRSDHSVGMRSNKHYHSPLELPIAVSLGLSNKMMSLLHELYEAYKASTDIDSLMAIIHAGPPAVACAITEVLRSLTVFRGLDIATVLGYNGDVENRASNDPRSFEYRKWQGPDTDDEEVSSFVAGESNIIVVSNDYINSPNRRPFPHCPLIIRYDCSSADPQVDGGGGRCRVIVFQEFRKPKNLHPAPNGNAVTENAATDQNENGKTLDLTATRDDVINVEEVAVETPKTGAQQGLPQVIPEKEAVTTKSILEANQKPNHPQQPGSPRPKQGRSDSRKHEKSPDSYPAETFHCKPPKSILGPNLLGRERSYVYRILLFNDEQKPKAFPLDEAMRLGLEDYAVVLSERLDDDDVALSLKEVETGAGNGTQMKGYIKLDYQGSITFDREKLKKAQDYTTLLFSLMDPTYQLDNFDWAAKPDNSKSKKSQVDITSDTYLRRYFVLPLTRLNDKEDVVMAAEPTNTSSGENPIGKQKPSTEESWKSLRHYFCDEQKTLVPLEKHMKVDWASIDFLLKLQDRELHKEKFLCCNSLKPKEYHTLEGKLLFSSLPSENMLLAGRLDHKRSPMSRIKRSRKFGLNDDGTFIPHPDIALITGLVANRETIRKQAQATGKDKDVINLDELKGVSSAAANGKGTSNEKVPVRWCLETEKLVEIPKDEVKGNISHFLEFNCSRNVLKKRSKWVGRVCHEIEPYYNRFYQRPIVHLDQPLLYAVMTRKASVQELLKVLNGESLEDICSVLVSDGSNGRFVVPELSRIYPLSVGCIFLPVSLFYIEQHLQSCELRNMFKPICSGKLDMKMIIRSVTASFVNCTTNYERMEFLGDSVLKLSSTIRLVHTHAHSSEGVLTGIRAHQVSNFRMFVEAKRMELYNYIRFATQTEQEWTPPGTDAGAKAIRVQMKGLADVVEALCGAYFLYGVSGAGAGDKSSPNKRLRKEGSVGKTNGRVSSDEGNDSDVECIDDEDAKSDDQLTPNEVGGGDGGKTSSPTPSPGASNQSRKRKRSTSSDADVETRLTATSAERGYYLACKFLEFCNVFQDEEPCHREFLLSGIHSLLPKGLPRPTDITFDAFPPEPRLTHPDVPWDSHLGVLEDILGYKFKRRHLLVVALTHGSYIKKDGSLTPVTETYERFEFLGDAVADFFVVCYLYERCPQLGPGDMTALKGNVVSNETFSRVTVAKGIHKFVYHSSASLAGDVNRFIRSLANEPIMCKFFNRNEGTGNSNMKNNNQGTQANGYDGNNKTVSNGNSNGHVNPDDSADDISTAVHTGYKRDLSVIAAPKILGDVFEAIIGAVLIDSGVAQAWRVCHRLLEDSLHITTSRERDDMHPCDELADLVSRVWKIPDWPSYEFQKWADIGPKGKQCIVYILGEKIAHGLGSNERRARLKAATNAIDFLRNKNPDSPGAKLLASLMEKGMRLRVAQQRKGH